MGGDGFNWNVRSWDWEDSGSGGGGGFNDDKVQAKNEAADLAETKKKQEVVELEKKDAARKRANLFKTSGGVAGEEILSGQTSQRSAIFGNA
jgi:hypothetical protein